MNCHGFQQADRHARLESIELLWHKLSKPMSQVSAHFVIHNFWKLKLCHDSKHIWKHFPPLAKHLISCCQEPDRCSEWSPWRRGCCTWWSAGWWTSSGRRRGSQGPSTWKIMERDEHGATENSDCMLYILWQKYLYNFDLTYNLFEHKFVGRKQTNNLKLIW